MISIVELSDSQEYVVPKIDISVSYSHKFKKV